jgi:hypothetical protein
MCEPTRLLELFSVTEVWCVEFFCLVLPGEDAASVNYVLVRSEETERNYLVRQRNLLAYRTRKYFSASIINHVSALFNIRVAR